jgi:hypothetical protein
VELVGRESVCDARFENVTSAALPQIDNHVAALCVQLCRSCLALRTEAITLAAAGETTARKY